MLFVTPSPNAETTVCETFLQGAAYDDRRQRLPRGHARGVRLTTQWRRRNQKLKSWWQTGAAEWSLSRIVDLKTRSVGPFESRCRKRRTLIHGWNTSMTNADAAGGPAVGSPNSNPVKIAATLNVNSGAADKLELSIVWERKRKGGLSVRACSSGAAPLPDTELRQLFADVRLDAPPEPRLRFTGAGTLSITAYPGGASFGWTTRSASVPRHFNTMAPCLAPAQLS